MKLIHPPLFFVYFRVDIGISAVLNESRIEEQSCVCLGSPAQKKQNRRESSRPTITPSRPFVTSQHQSTNHVSVSRKEIPNSLAMLRSLDARTDCAELLLLFKF